MTKFGVVTYVEKRHDLGSTMPRNLRGRGINTPNFWDPTYANTMWHVATKFCMTIKL